MEINADMTNTVVKKVDVLEKLVQIVIGVIILHAPHMVDQLGMSLIEKLTVYGLVLISITKWLEN